MTAACYEITVEGHLDRERWSHWFEGMDVSLSESGTTRISGRVADQAALHGLLAKVRDLGLVLISVQRTQLASPTHRNRVGDGTLSPLPLREIRHPPAAAGGPCDQQENSHTKE